MPSRDQLFADIDSMAPDRFAAHLAEDVTMRFGNAEPVHGRAAVRDAWASFCQGVDGVRHDIVAQWTSGDTTVVEARVTYTRQDGREVTVPVATIYHEAGGAIDDYRIYIDLTPLFTTVGEAGEPV